MRISKGRVLGFAALLALLAVGSGAAQTQSISRKVTASQIVSTGSIGVDGVASIG